VQGEHGTRVRGERGTRVQGERDVRTPTDVIGERQLRTPGALPFTGADIAGFIAAALVVLLLGMLLTLIGSPRLSRR